MPAKGRRVASRQAQLGRRRRKSARVGGAPATQAPSAVVDAQPKESVESQPRQPVAPVTAERENGRSRSVPPMPQRVSRVRGERPAAYNYVVPEVRRIVIMAGILLVVLVILAIFL